MHSEATIPIIPVPPARHPRHRQDGGAGLRVCAPGEGPFNLQGFDEETRVSVFDFKGVVLGPGKVGMTWADHMSTGKCFHPEARRINPAPSAPADALRRFLALTPAQSLSCFLGLPMTELTSARKPFLEAIMDCAQSASQSSVSLDSSTQLTMKALNVITAR
jgi:hypothetical protein